LYPSSTAVSVIWKAGFPYHRPQVSYGSMARRPDWRQEVGRKTHQHRGSPGTAWRRISLRSTGSFGHSPTGCNYQKVIRALSEGGRVARPEGTRRARAAPAPRARGAPAGHPTSPRGTRTWDARRTRRALGEP